LAVKHAIRNTGFKNRIKYWFIGIPVGGETYLGDTGFKNNIKVHGILVQRYTGVRTQL